MLQFSCGHCSLEQQVKQTDPAQNSLNEGTMRLTADPLDEKGKPWNDGQEDKTFRWYGEHGKKGYLYEIYARLDNRRITILVSDETVWIDFLDGGSIHTNIRPKGLFKKKHGDAVAQRN